MIYISCWVNPDQFKYMAIPAAFTLAIPLKQQPLHP